MADSETSLGNMDDSCRSAQEMVGESAKIAEVIIEAVPT